jgi:hypothetical protein
VVDGDGVYLCKRDIDPTRVLASLRAGTLDAFVRAIDLHDGQERLLPAQRVFPLLRDHHATLTPCGTSAAFGWREALAHGLLQHCVRLTLSGRAAQRSEAAVLDIEEFDSDPDVRFLSAMVRAARIDVAVADVTGPLGVPVVSAISNAGPIVYGGGGRVVDAVRQALTATLLGYQRRRDSALRAVMTTSTSAPWTDPSAQESPSPDRLVDALRRQGYVPSVVALDHDPAVHELFPCLLRVVVSG